VTAPAPQPLAACPEDTDFFKTKALRLAIHSRERGLCFYCLRRLTALVRCLDRAVPRVESGCNSYRNLVSCCLECNSQKGERSAADFLRWLYRERRLTAVELAGRLRALDALALPEAPSSSPCARQSACPQGPSATSPRRFLHYALPNLVC
jgi:hypothetical protein